MHFHKATLLSGNPGSSFRISGQAYRTLFLLIRPFNAKGECKVGAKLIRNKDVVKILEFSKRYKEMEYYRLNLLYMNQN